MDDFGTGYSNLAYLQRLPIDVLKIDRSFVEHMVDDRDKVAIVRTIQSLAEVLGMKTTAEGVETTDQARLLSAPGCDFGQGFLLARPMVGKPALDYVRQSLVRPLSVATRGAHRGAPRREERRVGEGVSVTRRYRRP